MLLHSLKGRMHSPWGGLGVFYRSGMCLMCPCQAGPVLRPFLWGAQAGPPSTPLQRPLVSAERYILFYPKPTLR